MTTALAPAPPPPVRIAVIPAVPVRSMRRIVVEPAGDWTVADVVEATGLDPESIRCVLEGAVVEPGAWSSTVPQPGDSLLVQQRPAGIELGIGAWIAAGIGATGAAAIATSVAINVAIAYGVAALARSLLAPAENSTEAAPAGTRRTIAGSSNEFRPYGAQPQVLGEHRVYPDLAARSFTTVENGKLFQYALFTFGHGTLQLSDLRIGEDPLFREDTAISYSGIMESDTERFVSPSGNALVKLELRQGTDSDEDLTLVTEDIHEQIIGYELKKERGWHRVRTVTGAVRISIIVGCPNGLIWRKDSGKVKTRTVRIGLRYRLVGTETWNDLIRVQMTAKSMSSQYATREVDVEEGTYEIEARRITETAGDSGIIDDTFLVSLLVTRAGPPVLAENVCLVAARIKLTNEFTDPVANFNAIAKTVCLDWNGSSWVEAATSNPASLYRLVLQGAANQRPLADSRIDLTELAAWHEECSAEGFEFNYVTQGSQTVPDVLRLITTAGRASPAVTDGLVSVVRENDLSGAPVQHLTPRNCRRFWSRREYVTIPHVLRVQFVNPEEGWLDTERVVYDDGYTAANATKFERLDIAGVTSPEQAYKLGRYHLAVLRLRPEEYFFDVDFEWKDLRRGDWVKAQHDAILVGLGAGRVTSVTIDGSGDATDVELDQICTMETGKSYAIRFRKRDGSTVYAPVDLDVGDQTALTFTTPIDSLDPQPEVGDLFLFGIAGSESIDLVVKDIEPTEWPNAIVTCVDAAAAVLTAAAGTIPTYDPQITLPPSGTSQQVAAASRVSRRVRPAAVTSSDVRDQEGRGPVIRRGLRVRFQPSGVVAV